MREYRVSTASHGYGRGSDQPWSNVVVRQPVIRTPRLVLEPLRPEHGPGVIAVFADPATSRYLSRDFSDAAAAAELVGERLAYAGPPMLGSWVVRCEDGVIGLAHLSPSRRLPPSFVDTGWFIAPKYAGAGLCTEAMRALLDYGVSELGLPAVWALIHPENVASQAVARKLGFAHVGDGRYYGGTYGVHALVVAWTRPA